MRVLVATDGSECSYQAARQFIHFAHAAHHEVTVLFVIPLATIGRSVGYLEVENEREAMGALNTVKHIFTEAGVSVNIMLLQGIPADTILQVLRDEKFDLLVIGARGRGGFREIFLGSVSKRIIKDAPCSVFIGR